MPAKRIIILEREPGARIAFSYVLRADVPLARQSFYASATAVSLYPQASAAETAEVRTGAVVEKAGRYADETPDGIQTVGQAVNAIQAKWQAFQDAVNAETKFSRYGSFWDGTSWTTQGA